jgi:hypothetical protein
VAGGGAVVTAEVGDEGVEALVAGDDVESAVGVGDPLSADFCGEDEVEGVFAFHFCADETDLGGEGHELFDEFEGDLGLVFADDHDDHDGFTGDEVEIDGLDVFEVDEEVVSGWGCGHASGGVYGWREDLTTAKASGGWEEE